jgi:agmatine deiminase
VLAWTDDEKHDAENYRRCRDAQLYLQSVQDAKGRALQITKLYLPSPPLRYTHDEAMSLAIPPDIDEKSRNSSNDAQYIMVRHPNEKMAASYVNYYIANEAILVPQFGGSAKNTDQQACDTLQRLFPSRKVVGVPSREILLGGGNIHCQTQQVPLAT